MFQCVSLVNPDGRLCWSKLLVNLAINMLICANIKIFLACTVVKKIIFFFFLKLSSTMRVFINLCLCVSQCIPGCLTIQIRTVLCVFIVLLIYAVAQACVVNHSNITLSHISAQVQSIQTEESQRFITHAHEIS